MKFTIIGCGNSGLIHAAKLYEKGFEVALLKTSSTNGRFFDIMNEQGGFKALDDTIQGNGHSFFVKPTLITRDVKEAVECVKIMKSLNKGVEI